MKSKTALRAAVPPSLRTHERTFRIMWRSRMSASDNEGFVWRERVVGRAQSRSETTRDQVTGFCALTAGTTSSNLTIPTCTHTQHHKFDKLKVHPHTRAQRTAAAARRASAATARGRRDRRSSIRSTTVRPFRLPRHAPSHRPRLKGETGQYHGLEMIRVKNSTFTLS